MAEVTTIKGGHAAQHQNALTSAEEIRHLQGVGDHWTVTCRNVPLPPPGAEWGAFPEYTFEIGQQALRAAIAEISDLYVALSAM